MMDRRFSRAVAIAMGRNLPVVCVIAPTAANQNATTPLLRLPNDAPDFTFHMNAQNWMGNNRTKKMYNAILQ